MGGQVIRIVRHADDLVIQVKEEMVLQGMIGRRSEIGKCYEMEMNVGTAKVMEISRQPSTVQIMVDQKQLENVA
jgi:hypothetical protein